MHDFSQLKHFGYDEFFELERVRLGAVVENVVRVTAEHKGVYEVVGASGSCRAVVTGKRMLTATGRDDFPAVGDWVVIKDGEDATKVIVDILPRRTTLHKRYGGKDEAQLISANVDVAFIVESTDRDYSLNRFERYLVLARQGGVKPVFILNKSDLSSESDMAQAVSDIRQRFEDVDVLVTSTVTHAGLNALTDYIQQGKTYCFVGSSGAGKSSLINKLLDDDLIATQAIGEKSGRGMHTTTSREMYVTGSGGIIIDNPGSREVGVVDSKTGVVEVFSDIEDIARQCKFQDCHHEQEPGCAVQDALRDGTIAASRYENYMRLQKENKHYEMSSYKRRQKDKKFGKFVKNAKAVLKKYESLD